MSRAEPLALHVPKALMKAIVDAAEGDYPCETCGLILGRVGEDGHWIATEIVASPNLAANARRAFEIDPKLRIDAQRRARAAGLAVVGLYHSHPDASARPSTHDLERAWETGLVWVITSVVDGQAVLSAAYRLAADGARFESVDLGVEDGPTAGPERAPTVVEPASRLAGEQGK